MKNERAPKGGARIARTFLAPPLRRIPVLRLVPVVPLRSTTGSSLSSLRLGELAANFHESRSVLPFSANFIRVRIFGHMKLHHVSSAAFAAAAFMQYLPQVQAAALYVTYPATDTIQATPRSAESLRMALSARTLPGPSFRGPLTLCSMMREIFS